MLTPEEKKKLASVERNLNMPRWRFILSYGLFFGLALVLVTSVLEVLTGRATVEQLFLQRFWINLAIIVVSGFLFAKIFHWQLVKKYLALKQKEKV